MALWPVTKLKSIMEDLATLLRPQKQTVMGSSSFTTLGGSLQIGMFEDVTPADLSSAPGKESSGV